MQAVSPKSLLEGRSRSRRSFFGSALPCCEAGPEDQLTERDLRCPAASRN